MGGVTLAFAGKYFLVWLLLAVVAIANGVVRQTTYGKVLPELAAHQVSTATAILASGVVVWIACRLWPLQSSSEAWTVGFTWLVLTVIFEFGFGHYVASHSWERLLADYNVWRGRVWGLFLIWVTVLPFLVLKFGK